MQGKDGSVPVAFGAAVARNRRECLSVILKILAAKAYAYGAEYA
jgi:hypothetical protein